MRSSSCLSLRKSYSHIPWRPCRSVAGSRIPIDRRSFRALPQLRSIANDPDTSDGARDRKYGLSSRPELEESSKNEQTRNSNPNPPDDPAANEENGQRTSPKFKEKSNYIRRATRNARKSKETPTIEIPSWFLERNVILRSGSTPQEPQTSRRLIISGQPPIPATTSPESSGSSSSSESRNTTTQNEDGESITYEIDHNIYNEIAAFVAAGLRPAPKSAGEGLSSSKPHLVLQCPKDGGSKFLEAVVGQLALDQEADIIKIDALDIAQLAESVNHDGMEVPDMLRSVGYDTYDYLGREESQSAEENEMSDDAFEDTEDSLAMPRAKQPSRPKSSTMTLPIISVIGSGRFADFLKNGRLPRQDDTSGPGSMSIPQLLGGAGGASMSSSQVNDDTKYYLYMMLDTFIDAPQVKRKPAGQSASQTAAVEPSPEPTESNQALGELTAKRFLPSKPLLILVKDYAELNSTMAGSSFLKNLHTIVSARRTDGQRTMIIGTTASDESIELVSRSSFKAMQSESFGPYRTILTPCQSPAVEELFLADEKAKIHYINIRNIQQMLRNMATAKDDISEITAGREFDIGSTEAFVSGLHDSVWNFEQVNRTVALALGRLEEGVKLTAAHISQALSILDLSDNAKFDWLSETHAKEKVAFPLGGAQTIAPDEAAIKQQNRMKRLRKTCNTHEKKLLNGVVDSANIRTTFADVRAPSETIEGLRTLTSLFLTRPEAFTYGVLATDKIPGLLLYGPPGTGKTLLAKAVAKESGATVLEVSGSDVYDMYVGEGEKNVRAIFSLAQKLSPCIVFIDEADAIFGSRGSSTNRSSHRELINQFLREWDGMNDMSAFIMVATNRPFDLDDAVLRRLPRRLLVDLPTQKDREAILQIHLKDEVLDSGVSLSALAAKTPFFSGSDLKNLSVAAALACVREESDAAAAHTGSDKFAFSAKRVLMEKHFEKALQEISASISEDMGSLSAIRKFDERFGEKAGRKKRGAYGFGTESDVQREKLAEKEVRIRET